MNAIHSGNVATDEATTKSVQIHISKFQCDTVYARRWRTLSRAQDLGSKLVILDRRQNGGLFDQIIAKIKNRKCLV